MRRRVILFLTAGLLFPGPAMAEFPAGQSGVYDTLNLFEQAFARVRHDAVEKMGGEHLVRAAIAGMLSSLDPNAAYFDEAALSLESGAGDTVGLAVRERHGTVRVIAARDGSPAAAAGIEAGDIILTIGREPAAAMSLGQIEKRLQGPPASKVTLRLERLGVDHPLKVVVTRATFRLQTVSARLLGDLGYIRLAGFDAGTLTALSAAIEGLRQTSGNKLKGIILDLRNNSGGQFEAAVKVADAFLAKGVIAQIQTPRAPLKPIPASPGDLARGLPMAALINGGTAGEAELVAAALLDNHRAILIGSRSFGENAIETMIPLANGGAIRLATARFLTPRGHQIEGKGLTPDIAVKPVKLVKLAEGLRIREADLPGALRNPNLEKSKGTPPAAVPASTLASPEDEQLVRAADILRALAITNSPDPS
jgi:carboxyl-terminal processing protease